MTEKVDDSVDEPLLPEVPPSLDVIAGKEEPTEKLLRTFDQNMDVIVAGIKNALRVTILLAERDAEFTPVKERIKELVSRGVIPYLEDMDTQISTYMEDGAE